LIAGDLAPVLRAEFITAVRAAAEHDTAPLARLLARGEPAEPTEGIDLPLYYATSCEEELFPWSRSASPAARLRQARAAVAALPAGATLPFDKANVLRLSDMPACAYWPFATPAPPALAGALPDVPALVLSGTEDLRTPTAYAQAVAARIPDSHLLVVPDTAHSVLTSEPTQCAHRALLAQFAGQAIKPCRATPPPAVLRPPPLPPTRLVALSPAPGYSGRPGRTLHALGLTFSDLARQLGLALGEMVASGQLASAPVLRSGGLRAGWMRYAGGEIALDGYSYVPGVRVSGWIGSEVADLRIGGRAAAHGTLRLAHRHTLVGLLGGQRVRIGTADLGGATARVAAGPRGVPSSVPPRIRIRSALALEALLRSLARLPVPTASG
jgi:hypothetical protein